MFALGLVLARRTTTRLGIGSAILLPKNLVRAQTCTASSPLENIKENVINRQQLRYQVLDDFVESLNEPVTTSEIGFLFDCICRYLPAVRQEEKAGLIAKLWAKVKVWKSPSEEDYVSWLRACRECKVGLKVEDISEELGNYEPSLKLYEEILYLTSSVGESDETLQVLDYIREEGFPLTEKIFNALIVAHSRDKNIESCESVLELMDSANLTPNDETKYEMVRAYINNDLWDNAEMIINLVAFEPRQLMEILRCSVANSGSDQFLSMLIKKFPIDLINPREISPIFRNFIIELIHIEKRPQAVMPLLSLLPKPNPSLLENEDIYGAFVLHELFEADQPFKAIKGLCEFLVKTGRNCRAPFVATEMSLRRYSPLGMDFLKYLSEFGPLKPHYFWPLIITEFQSNGEQGVLDLIKEMNALGVEMIDSDTVQFYILPRISLKNVEDGVKALTKAGVKMSELIDPLLSQLLSLNRYQDFIRVVETYPTKFKTDQLMAPLAKNFSLHCRAKDVLRVLKVVSEKSPPNSDFNGPLLMELANNNKFIQLESLAGEMVGQKAKMSQVAKDRLMERIKTVKNLKPEQRSQIIAVISNVMSSNSSPLSSPSYLESKHPQEMNFDELECHLAELEGKGLNARGVIRKMLQMAVKEKRYERALELKSKCDKLNVDLSPGMLASCVEMYAKTNNSDLALQSLKSLQEEYPNFIIDEHKAIDLATCLIKEDRFDVARRILTERAKYNKVIGEKNNKNVWHLLNTISDKSLGTENDNSTKRFLNFLVKLKYCSHSNTLLGPCIREFLNQKDIRGAVAEFKLVCKSYRKTPLNLELLTILVGIKNGQHDGFADTAEVDVMIQDVYNAIESVHGGGAAKMSLLFATAERGNDKQVRKILIDPTTRLEPQALQKQCEYLVLAGKTNPLFRLIKSSRGLAHTAINEQQLLCSLMQSLSKQNNVEDALKLFDRLLEEDEFKINKKIAEIVIDLLKRNNLELPSRLQTFNV